MRLHLGGALRCFSILAVALSISGCSSTLKEYNPRMGLLDVLSGMEPAYHSGDLAREEARDRADRRALAWRQSKVGVFPIPPRGEGHPIPARYVAARNPDFALTWPLRSVQITSPFGRRGREFHEGIDLRASPGTPVYAAHAGQVLYANNRIRGYGDMIVLRHSSGLATIYAHNSRLVVHRGEWVRRGELIAYTGETGDARGPHLHFEVRQGINAVNPMRFLPPVRHSRGRSIAAR